MYTETSVHVSLQTHTNLCMYVRTCVCASQVVDVCVEIPQFGVIRSLNVHVSAALAVWEITKQNVDFSKTTAPTLNTA
jgi:hypothetical protein